MTARPHDQAPADRAAVLREAADAIATQDPATAPLVGVHARAEDVALLRRMADEAQEAADDERAMRVPGTWNLEPGQIPPPQQLG